ncbi:MAG: hypothetical protein Q9222_003385 [Ikaeria aurantiellina]
MDLVTVIHALLSEVAADPAGKMLDGKLLERFDSQSTETIEENDRDMLIHDVATVLPLLQQDPTPAANLVQLLIRPPSFTFSRVREIQPAIDFSAGLKAPSPPINMMTLVLLEKAKYSRSDAEIVATEPDVVASLIELWLSTPDTDVADKAQTVILGLLTVHNGDQEDASASAVDQEPYNQSLMWRRVFRDKTVYGSIYRICSLSTAGQEGQLSKSAKTVAQARLLDLLAKVDCAPLRTSQLQEVESQYDVGAGGLLEFAALRMVDYKDDFLMHVTLINFYSELLKPRHSVIETLHITDRGTTSSPTLDFLEQTGLHDQTLSYFFVSSLQGSLDASFLYGPAARYLATYCSYYPGHFLMATTAVQSTIRRLNFVLQSIPPHAASPTHDLHVMASLPRIALLPSRGLSPFYSLNATPKEDVLKTFATVFHGPDSEQPNPLESIPARMLYFLYLYEVNIFWSHVVRIAETVALLGPALAAIDLIKAVVTARWAPLPPGDGSASSGLSAEQELAIQCDSSQLLPLTGVEAILAPEARNHVFPFLFSPARTFSNVGDVESAAYRVAEAKYDVLRSLKSGLLQLEPRMQHTQPLIAAIDRRLAAGVIGGGNSGEGGSVSTLES